MILAYSSTFSIWSKNYSFVSGVPPQIKKSTQTTPRSDVAAPMSSSLDHEISKKDSSPTIGDLSWPEENSESHQGINFFVHEYRKWTYSYMNPLLQKGSQQTFADGSHLGQDDLFRIPSSIKSSFLSSEFK